MCTPPNKMTLYSYSRKWRNERGKLERHDLNKESLLDHKEVSVDDEGSKDLLSKINKGSLNRVTKGEHQYQ